jgi:phosphate transport system protein
MNHLDIELKQLKEEMIEMWNLVLNQLKKAKQAVETLDKDLAREVLSTEKRVNALEVKIDRDCENIFALFNPVAVDLRFVLAVLKINNNLERTGDIAEGISKFVISTNHTFDKNLIELTRLDVMFQEAIAMSTDALHAFNMEDTKIARSIFQKDEVLDDINIKATDIIATYIKTHPENIESILYLLSSIRKLERVGDQMKNIAEEIIFYIEAKILKHTNKLG